MREKFKKRWAKQPLFFLALGLVFIAAADHFFPKIAWGIALTCVAGLFYFVGKKVGIFASFLVIFCVGGLRLRDFRQATDEAAFQKLGLAQVEAELLEDATGEERAWSAMARLRGTEYGGKKVRWIGAGEPPPCGAICRASGVFEPLEIERNPGVPQQAERWRNEGVVAIFRASAMRAELWVSPLNEGKARLKKTFREGMIVGLEPEGDAAKVIRAIVMGERARNSLGLIRKFRESGTLHIFSVSGMHVVILGSIIWLALKAVYVPRRVAIPLIMLAMFCYAWLTGNSPAALRAACMGTLFLAAFLFRRRPDLLNALGGVFILSLLWEPRLIRMPGVQLSYGVVAAIGIGADWARSCLSWAAQEERYLPQSEKGFFRHYGELFRKKIVESFAVSTAASVGSLPLSIFHFGMIAPISLFATVALIPLVYVILALGLMASLVYPISQNGAIFLNRLNAPLAHACTETAEFFANLSGASGPVSTAYRDSLILYDLNYGAACACFTSKAGNSILIDTGGKFSLQSELGSSFMQLGLRPDSFLFSHQDSGHAAPVSLLSEMFSVKQIISEKIDPKNVLAHPKIHFLKAQQGQRIDFGPHAWGEVLWANEEKKTSSARADDRAWILRLHWHGWKILFTGDAGLRTEEAMRKSGMDLAADFLVTGLHERDLSLSDPFLAAVHSQAIITPRAASSPMDALRHSQKSLWQKRGIRVIDQQKTGGLTLKILASGELQIRGFLSGSEHVFLRR